MGESLRNQAAVTRGTADGTATICDVCNPAARPVPRGALTVLSRSTRFSCIQLHSQTRLPVWSNPKYDIDTHAPIAQPWQRHDAPVSARQLPPHHWLPPGTVCHTDDGRGPGKKKDAIFLPLFNIDPTCFALVCLLRAAIAARSLS